MIYISTGGFSQKTPTETIKKFNKYGISFIELSSGKYIKNIGSKLKKLLKKNNFLAHNYFPVPKRSFVLNLASLNKNINKRSLMQIKKSINLSRKLNSKFFSFHAGFYLDPNIKSLGKKFDKPKLFDTKKSKKIFFTNVEKLIKFAEKKNIKLLIENNVITKDNIEFYGKNPLMMCDPKEIKEFKSRFNNKIGILLDTGHLKVSSKTLKRNFFNDLKNISKYVEAYHLSDNNGYKDSNKKIHKNSKIWKYLNYNVDYFTIEVYTKSIQVLKNQINLLKQKIYDAKIKQYNN